MNKNQISTNSPSVNKKQKKTKKKQKTPRKANKFWNKLKNQHKGPIAVHDSFIQNSGAHTF